MLPVNPLLDTSLHGVLCVFNINMGIKAKIKVAFLAGRELCQRGKSTEDLTSQSH